MRPLVISGVSGSGKSYLVNVLTSNHDYRRVIPVTTREPRQGEINGESYYFVTPERYSEMLFANEFFMSNDFFRANYGIQRSEVDRIISQGFRPVVEIYTPTVDQFLREFPDSDTVFMRPDDLELIKQRMIGRGDPPEKVEYRMQGALSELQFFQDQAQQYYQRVLSVSGDDLSPIINEILELRRVNDNNEMKNENREIKII